MWTHLSSQDFVTGSEPWDAATANNHICSMAAHSNWSPSVLAMGRESHSRLKNSTTILITSGLTPMTPVMLLSWWPCMQETCLEYTPKNWNVVLDRLTSSMSWARGSAIALWHLAVPYRNTLWAALCWPWTMTENLTGCCPSGPRNRWHCLFFASSRKLVDLARHWWSTSVMSHIRCSARARSIHDLKFPPGTLMIIMDVINALAYLRGTFPLLGRNCTRKMINFTKI